jgi:phage gpG-like protein
MPVRLGAQITGLAEISERIGGITARAADPRPALEVVANLLELHVQRNFETQGAQGGKPWPPLAASTVRARTKRWGYYRRWSPTSNAGPSGPILVWHGRLQRSFARGGVAHIRIVSPSGLTWGSGVVYGIYHQSTRPRSRLPWRPPIAFRDDFQQREILFQPIRLYLQGVPPGAIEGTMRARLRV